MPNAFPRYLGSSSTGGGLWFRGGSAEVSVGFVVGTSNWAFLKMNMAFEDRPSVQVKFHRGCLKEVV